MKFEIEKSDRSLDSAEVTISGSRVVIYRERKLTAEERTHHKRGRIVVQRVTIEFGEPTPKTYILSEVCE